MSDSKGFGALGLPGAIGAIVAWCSNPTFQGWAGVGKSLLVGSGTAMGAGLCAVPGVIAGLVVGLALRSKKAGVGVALVGVLGGGIYGGIKAYGNSNEWLTQKNNSADCFNNKAAKPSAAKTTTASQPRLAASAKVTGSGEVLVF